MGGVDDVNGREIEPVARFPMVGWWLRTGIVRQVARGRGDTDKEEGPAGR